MVEPLLPPTIGGSAAIEGLFLRTTTISRVLVGFKWRCLLVDQDGGGGGSGDDDGAGGHDGDDDDDYGGGGGWGWLWQWRR